MNDKLHFREPLFLQPAKMEVDSNPQKGNSTNTTPKNSPVKSTLKVRIRKLYIQFLVGFFVSCYFP